MNYTLLRTLPKFSGKRSFHPQANGSVKEDIHDISLKKED